MIPLDQLITDLETHGTVTVDWKTLADLHFPSRNGEAKACKWAAEHGFVLIFIHPGDRDRSGQGTKATFYRSVQHRSANS